MKYPIRLLAPLQISRSWAARQLPHPSTRGRWIPGSDRWRLHRKVHEQARGDCKTARLEDIGRAQVAVEIGATRSAGVISCRRRQAPRSSCHMSGEAARSTDVDRFQYSAWSGHMSFRADDTVPRARGSVWPRGLPHPIYLLRAEAEPLDESTCHIRIGTTENGCGRPDTGWSAGREPCDRPKQDIGHAGIYRITEESSEPVFRGYVSRIAVSPKRLQSCCNQLGRLKSSRIRLNVDRCLCRESHDAERHVDSTTNKWAFSGLIACERPIDRTHSTLESRSGSSSTASPNVDFLSSGHGRRQESLRHLTWWRVCHSRCQGGQTHHDRETGFGAVIYQSAGQDRRQSSRSQGQTALMDRTGGQTSISE